MGTNNYPRSINKTMNLLNIFAKTSKRNGGKKFSHKTENAKVEFAQAREFTIVVTRKVNMSKPVQKRDQSRPNAYLSC